MCVAASFSMGMEHDQDMECILMGLPLLFYGKNVVFRKKLESHFSILGAKFYPSPTERVCSPRCST